MLSELAKSAVEVVFSVALLPTSDKDWENDKATLRPEQFYNDEGYIYIRDNHRNIVYMCSRNNGWYSAQLGYVDNINSLIIDKVSPKVQRAIRIYPNPIRYRLIYSANKHFIIEKVVTEKLPGFNANDTTKYPYKEQFTREAIIAERNKLLHKNKPTIVVKEQSVIPKQETSIKN